MNGNIYVAGGFSRTVDFDSGTGTSNATSAGFQDIFILKLSNNGDFIWVKTMGAINPDVALDIALDASGNIYTTGYFKNTVDFDPNIGVFNITLPLGKSGFFISKLDNNGNFIWAKAIDIGTTVIYTVLSNKCLKIDTFGNIYTMAGFGFGGTVIDLDPSVGVFNVTALGAVDIFIIKLDTNGNFVWGKAIQGQNNEFGQSLSLDALGNLYLSGTYQGTIDCDPNAGIFNLTSASLNKTNSFLIKLNNNGSLIWAKAILSSIDLGDPCVSTIDRFGDIYITGRFKGTTDFDPNGGVFNLTATGTNGIYMSKINTNGNFVWATSIEGITDGFSNAITVDASDNIYTAGNFKGMGDFDPNAGVFSLPVINGGGNYIAKYFQCSSFSINAANLPKGALNVPYSQTLTQNSPAGTPIWSVSGGDLPNGLSLNPSTGAITGTPSASGTFSFTVQVINGSCAKTQQFSITIACLVITATTTLPNGTIAVPYNQTITQISAGTAIWSFTSGNLPNGLSLNTSNGAVIGLPITNGTYNFTVGVTNPADGTCFDIKSFTIIIACPIVTFINPTASIVLVNVSYTFDASATGNNAPLTYSVNPALPAGLSLNATTGIISGTPTTVTNPIIYTISTSQSGGACIYTQNYDLEVLKCIPFGLLPNANFLPSGYVNQPYVGAQISVANPVVGETYTFEKLNAINWQEGITLSPSGFISGTPTFSTSIMVVIQAKGQTTECKSLKATYTLVVYQDPTTSTDNVLSSQIKVLPNPSNGDFKVDFGSLQLGKGTLRVYDVQGKQVVFSEIEKNTQQMPISLENKANGIYLLEISSDKGRILKKLVKE